MAAQLTKFAAVLTSFTASSSDLFRVVASVPASRPRSAAPPRSRPRLYVLDSSFNPPTRAHLQIALSALLHDTDNVSKHLLLLLATTNADKAEKPASFDQRLMLMNIFASEVIKHYRQARSVDTDEVEPQIDICVTKLPYFVNKAAAIAESPEFDSDAEQIHLVGYDTLIRIFNPKYYPPTHTLATLQPFLEKHRLRVMYRPNDEWGDRAEEDAYVRGISEGSLESIGGKASWADRIDMVESPQDGGAAVSSTKAREAAKAGDVAMLKTLVSEGVADWIAQQELYQQ